MSQANSLLRMNLIDLVSGKARVKGFVLMGGDAFHGIPPEDPRACKRWHKSRPCLALGCWLLALLLCVGSLLSVCSVLTV